MKNIIAILILLPLLGACRGPQNTSLSDPTAAPVQSNDDSNQSQGNGSLPGGAGGGSGASTEVPGRPKDKPDFNALVLQAIREMPVGGGYSLATDASKALLSATVWKNGALLVSPEKASPSFCSGATYLVFLKALNAALAQESPIDPSVLKTLLITGQADGVGPWGRWNANGPGTARLVHELQLGRNFDDWEEARPGDFMKIFWSSSIGKSESGHSVVFLGVKREGGKDYVEFWSSNTPNGMGAKKVEKSRVVRAIFSRVEEAPRIAELARLPAKDQYLSDMLTRASSPEEVTRMVDLR